MLKNADNAVERVNDKNEAIHRASPVHSQQEHITTGLALCKDIRSPAIHRASPVYSQMGYIGRLALCKNTFTGYTQG